MEEPAVTQTPSVTPPTPANPQTTPHPKPLFTKKLLIILSIPAVLLLLSLIIIISKGIFSPPTMVLPTPTPVQNIAPTPTSIPWQGYKSDLYNIQFNFPANLILTEPPPPNPIILKRYHTTNSPDFSISLDIYSRQPNEDLKVTAQSFRSFIYGGRTTLPSPVPLGEYGDIKSLYLANLPAYEFSSLTCPTQGKICDHYFLANSTHTFNFIVSYTPNLSAYIPVFLSSINFPSTEPGKCTPSTDPCSPNSCDYDPSKCNTQVACTKDSDCTQAPCSCESINKNTADNLKDLKSQCAVQCAGYQYKCLSFVCKSISPTPKPKN